MKIGIATVYNSENCGSFLQAYASYVYIKKKGYDPYFVESIDWFSSSTCLFPGRLINIVKYLLRMNFVGAMMLMKRHTLFHKNLEYTNSCTCKVNRIRKLDKCLIGSDTIWNLNELYFRKRSPIYSGRCIPIPYFYYAASCGNITTQDVKKWGIDYSSISKADGISVRDCGSVDLVKAITGIEPTIVLDPTFIVGSDTFDKFDTIATPCKYLVVYCFGAIPFEQQYKIQQFARKNEFMIVTFGNKYKCSDIVVPNAPEYFISYFKHASAVITNTFHGTVFSVIYHKKFVVLTSNKLKINDLLKRIGLSNRIIIDNEMDKIILRDIDYSKIESVIEPLKRKSIHYLDQMLIKY